MKDAPEDLSVRARRGELTEAEERRLGVLLSASVEAKLLHLAGTALDSENSMRPGDEALAERIYQRVRARRKELRRGRERGGLRFERWAWVAAVACLSAVVTGGTLLAAQRYGNERVRALLSFEQQGQAPQVRRKAAEPKPGSRVDIPRVENSSPPTALAPAPTASAATPAVTRTLERSKAPVEGARALFASASLARREGSSAAAIELYDMLQRRYPSSDEARAADLSLGMLHLQRGQAARALSYFERSLQRSPRDEMASEALWGKASALSNLGRSEQAQRELAQLVERYPSSLYASAARAKLGAQRPKP